MKTHIEALKQTALSCLGIMITDSQAEALFDLAKTTLVFSPEQIGLKGEYVISSEFLAAANEVYAASLPARNLPAPKSVVTCGPLGHILERAGETQRVATIREVTRQRPYHNLTVEAKGETLTFKGREITILELQEGGSVDVYQDIYAVVGAGINTLPSGAEMHRWIQGCDQTALLQAIECAFHKRIKPEAVADFLTTAHLPRKKAWWKLVA